MTILKEDKTWRLAYEEAHQYFQTNWKNVEIEDQEFKQKMQDIAHLCLIYKPKAFLANTTGMQYSIVPTMQEWHNDLLFPVFAEIGLKKMAIVVSDHLFTQVSIEQAYDENPRHFRTQYFNSEETALIWICI